MQRSKKNQPIQTDQLTTETLKRFQSILSGPHVGAFCQVMDIFISGYGKLEIDSDVLCVRFLYEEKIKFWKKIYFQYRLVILEHHMKRKTKQINITHFYKFWSTENNMSNINTK